MEKFKKARLYDADGDLSQRWYVHYSYQIPDTKKFKRFIRAISTKIHTAAGRRERAHVIITEINNKLKEGWNPFSVVEKRYANLVSSLKFVLALKESSVRERTASTYRHHVNTFIDWLELNHMLKICLDDFTFHHAQAFMDYTKINLKHCNRTYNNRITAMVTLFNVLVKREYCQVNPFMKVQRLPKTEAKIISFTEYELEVMVKNLPRFNYDLYVCACLIFYCFIRPQELARLKVENIDLRRNMITLPGDVSKNKKTEIVHIPEALRPIIAKLGLSYPGNYYVFGKHQKRSKRYAAPTRIAEEWKKFCRKYELSKNIYSLKHTGVGMALENDVNIRDLQLQIRHHSLELTQVYLEKFNRIPSEKLSRNFPDIEKLYGSADPISQ